MALPFFYIEALSTGEKTHILNEETSKHTVQVLRMQEGEQLHLTDGKGNLHLAAIADANRKRCMVNIISTNAVPPPARNITIAVSLLKNTSRFEWFLEKATELGVSTILPLICARTEKQKFRSDRLQSILISAMLQSQQCWLPALPEPVKYTECIKQAGQQQKFIAHCEDEQQKQVLSGLGPFRDTILLIGPEGDFSGEEIGLALKEGFIAVSLGNTRLRTETAALAAAVLLCNV